MAKGGAGLFLAVAVLVIVLVGVPQSRLFFAFAVPIGIVAAIILHFWNKRPVKLKEDEVRLNLEAKDDAPRRKDQ